MKVVVKDFSGQEWFVESEQQISIEQCQICGRPLRVNILAPEAVATTHIVFRNAKGKILGIFDTESFPEVPSFCFFCHAPTEPEPIIVYTYPGGYLKKVKDMTPEEQQRVREQTVSNVLNYMKNKPDVDYLVNPAGDCIRFKKKSGVPSHYCFSIPYKACLLDSPPTRTESGGCIFSQYKPVWKRMQNKAKSK